MRIKFILLALIVLFVSTASLVQAAPPLQEGTQESDTETSLGDSLNLDDEGNVIEEAESGKNNLGVIMSSSDSEADESEETEEAVDAEDEEATEPGDEIETEVKQHPVATAISEYFDVTYEEVKSLHDAGYGFGNIAKAYFFAERLTSMSLDGTVFTPEDLLSAARGGGWGNVLKENGIHPGAVGHGDVEKQTGKPEHAASNDKAKPNKDDAIGKFTGQGGGKNIDKANGNGKSAEAKTNGHGKSKDKGNNGKGKGKNK